MKYLVGPELFWLLLYLGAIVLGKANTPPSKTVEDWIGPAYVWIPMASLLVFSLWWMPFPAKGALLLLRVWVFGIIGCWVVAEKVYAASIYQGPGVGMGLVGALCIQILMLAVGSAAVAVKVLWPKAGALVR